MQKKNPKGSCNASPNLNPRAPNPTNTQAFFVGSRSMHTKPKGSCNANPKLSPR
ncbi:unnamed protein product, partial [Sphagnum jensenii]